MKFTSCLLAAAMATCTVEMIPAANVRAEVRVAQALNAPRTNLTTNQAKSAASELLQSIQTKDAQRIFKLLASPLQAATSVEAISQRLQSAPIIESYRVVAINQGLDDTTVETVAVTNSGTRELPLLLVLDDDGQLLAWKWVETMLPIEQTALNFVKDLDAGRWIAARYYLDLDFQREISPADLKRKWSKLERVLGGVKSIKSALAASSSNEQQLVLVTIEFGNMTDNLFVIFNRQGQIINVDFSADLV
ncbi:putative conserved secreted protein [Synechococcus sp. BIOS-U3-1]|nr:putative conserved secreted protein [Synechococcus sp. BIOS-U3-1]